MPLNWYQVAVTYAKTCPNVEQLHASSNRVTNNNSVFIPAGSYETEIKAMRNFLHERGCKFRLFGRFSMSDRSGGKRFSSGRKSIGIRFEFADDAENCLFKLFWCPAL